MVTYGKCGEQLYQRLSGLRVKVAEQVVSITLPSEYMSEKPEQFSGTDSKHGVAFEFLTEAEDALARAAEEFTIASKAP